MPRRRTRATRSRKLQLALHRFLTSVGFKPTPRNSKIPRRREIILWGLVAVILTGVVYSIGGNNFKASIFSANQKSLISSVAQKYTGLGYLLGACGPDVIDCSCLTRTVLKEAVGVELPRTSREQAKVGREIAKANLGVGDLVFFATGGGGISHVGVVTKVSGGDIYMTHANSVDGRVQEEKITGVKYWEKTYVTAREITDFTKDLKADPDRFDTTARADASAPDASGVEYVSPVTGKTAAVFAQSEPLAGSFQ